MPVSPVANGTATASGSEVSPLTVTKPSGVIDGVEMICQVSSDQNTIISSIGWTSNVTKTPAVGQGLQVTVLRKIAASEPASWNFVASAGGTGSYAAVFAAYTNQDIDIQPAVVTQTASGDGLTSTATAPATTTQPDAGCYELAMYGENGAPNFSTPAGFGIRVSNSTVTTAVIFDQGPLTPTGVLPAVISTDTGSQWTAVHYVVKAVAGLPGFSTFILAHAFSMDMATRR